MPILLNGPGATHSRLTFPLCGMHGTIEHIILLISTKYNFVHYSYVS